MKLNKLPWAQSGTRQLRDQWRKVVALGGAEPLGAPGRAWPWQDAAGRVVSSSSGSTSPGRGDQGPCPSALRGVLGLLCRKDCLGLQVFKAFLCPKRSKLKPLHLDRKCHHPCPGHAGVSSLCRVTSTSGSTRQEKENTRLSLSF